MNVVIPMAGLGDRMKQAGYEDTKPMIDVLGKPMIQRVVENIDLDFVTYIFIVQAHDFVRYNLGEFLPSIVPMYSACEVLCIEGLTEGAACTALSAASFIENDTPLMIVNSDQIIDWKANRFAKLEETDGCIFCFKHDHPRFSYARADEDGKVVEVAEKKAISNDATAGAYYWARGKDFVNAALDMIEADDRVNNEFYTAPVYNYYYGQNVIIREVSGVSHLGTPEELEEFVNEHKE